jgi:hypothetical protein
MSPSVRLVCYPDGDGAFCEHAALTLRIDLPETYSDADVVAALQQRLREIPTWHVHRDGHPTLDRDQVTGTSGSDVTARGPNGRPWIVRAHCQAHVIDACPCQGGATAGTIAR